MYPEEMSKEIIARLEESIDAMDRDENEYVEDDYEYHDRILNTPMKF